MAVTAKSLWIGGAGFLFLLSLVAGPCAIHVRNPKERLARGRAMRIAIALRDFTYSAKRLPTDLRVLSEEGFLTTEDLIDPWGHAYQLRLLPSGEVEVVSAGADGVPGGWGIDGDIVFPATRLDQ